MASYKQTAVKTAGTASTKLKSIHRQQSGKQSISSNQRRNKQQKAPNQEDNTLIAVLTNKYAELVRTEIFTSHQQNILRKKPAFIMVVLTESSLNKRHREFNRKVTEAAEKNIGFDDLKVEGIESDVDNLFKIDLASKYKNIDYIVKVLKSGDSLCITRALKCTWMFGPEYSQIINPKYINDELLPYLSLKSKHKLLKTIACHVKDEQRSLEFYKFCKSMKNDNIAIKFLLFTNEETKINVLREMPENYSLIDIGGWTYIRHFIGDSFTLARTQLELAHKHLRPKLLYELRHLYYVNATKYLDFIETYDDSKNENFYIKHERFGLRISKAIITEYKDRIYKNPLLYTQLIQKSSFTKYSTVDDAKYYLTALLPSDANSFWYQNYYDTLKHLLDVIPMDEKYQFMKKIFNEKYPGEPFEMTKYFYNLQYYKLIVDLELKEKWALHNVESGKEILGPGRDYMWYRFVKFSKSVGEIKKYVRINKDADARAQIVEVLIESARHDRELETLFKYYYEKHINEKRSTKERFLEAVARYHNIFSFDVDCFAALDKIFYSLDMYTILATYYCKPQYKTIALFYRIINNMEIPEVLIKFIEDSIPFCSFYATVLTKEKETLLFNYLMDFYLNKIKSFDEETYDLSVQKSVRKYVHFVFMLMNRYKKPKEEIPEITMKYAYLDWDVFKHRSYFAESVTQLDQNGLLRCLKHDVSEFVSKLPSLKASLTINPFNVNRVLRKLRLYFSNDLAKYYIEFYMDILNKPDIDKRLVDILVFGVIHLADKRWLEDFMAKHVPTDTKIDHVNIDRKILSIQSAICFYAGYARPPIPLPLLLKYLKDDYTKYCLPIFNMYLANLQPFLLREFVKSIIDAPISIQKHGLRLAFQCFSTNNLKSLLTEVWGQTKNVTLRFLIYNRLHDKICESDDNDMASSLFETLNKFTSTVYEEDDDELFDLLTYNRLPESLQNVHLKTVWVQYEKLPFKARFANYRSNAVVCIQNNLNLIKQKDFIENIIMEHIQYVFEHTQDDEIYNMLRNRSVITYKWYLTTRYITFLKNNIDLHSKLNMIKLVTSKCIENWHKVFDRSNIYRNFFKIFLDLLKIHSYTWGLDSYRHANILFECIIKDLEETLPVQDIYQIMWELKLNIATRNLIVNANERKTNENGAEITKEAGIKFGKECVTLIAEYLARNMFWCMFADDIRQIISYEASNVASTVGNIINDFPQVNAQDIIVLTCNELIESKQFESLMLASEMLPTTYNTNRVYFSEYEQVMNKLLTLEDPQVNCFVYQKFMGAALNNLTLI